MEYDEAAWKEAVKKHRRNAVPAAREMPTLRPEEAAGLFRSIGLRGQLAPILVLDDGRIVDGVHRSAACELLGVEPVTEIVGEEDADSVAVETNADRRQMSEWQLAERASNYAINNDVTIAEAAAVWAVSERNISRVRRVQKNGSKKILAAAREGEISLGAAEERVAQLHEEREREARWKRQQEEAVPIVTEGDGLVDDTDRKLVFLTTGASRDQIIECVTHALGNGHKRLQVTDNARNCSEATVVAWKAPAKEQSPWDWRRVTIHAVGCADGWKKALPEWREPPAAAVRVTRTAATELGLSEGDHPRDAVVAALATYKGGSRAVGKLKAQLGR